MQPGVIGRLKCRVIEAADRKLAQRAPIAVGAILDRQLDRATSQDRRAARPAAVGADDDRIERMGSPGAGQSVGKGYAQLAPRRGTANDMGVEQPPSAVIAELRGIDRGRIERYLAHRLPRLRKIAGPVQC